MKEVKYEVLAEVYYEEEKELKTVVVGEFKEYICACLFQEAYYNKYKANTALKKIVKGTEIETYYYL